MGLASGMALPTLRSLSAVEQQVVMQMRRLATQSREWKLTLTMHTRKEGSYLQLEPTPYLRVVIQPDAFLAVE